MGLMYIFFLSLFPGLSRDLETISHYSEYVSTDAHCQRCHSDCHSSTVHTSNFTLLSFVQFKCLGCVIINSFYFIFYFFWWKILLLYLGTFDSTKFRPVPVLFENNTELWIEQTIYRTKVSFTCACWMSGVHHEDATFLPRISFNAEEVRDSGNGNDKADPTQNNPDLFYLQNFFL